MSMIDDYFDIYTKHVEEYQSVCLLYQCGTFYEIYQIDSQDEQFGNAREIATLLNIAYTSKNKAHPSSRKYPNLAGFGKAYLSKYLPTLLENNYTVVVVDELTSTSSTMKIERGVTSIYSASLNIYISEDNTRDNNLTGLLIESVQNGYIYSICNVDHFTNNIEISEGFVNILTEIDLPSNTRELVVYVKASENLNLECLNKTYKLYTWQDYKLDYVNTYLKNVYSHVNFGLITPIEFMDLEKYPNSINCFKSILEFMSRHDTVYIKNLSIPRIINKSRSNFLSLELNTCEQLNILSGEKSVFDIINHTRTAIGKRFLKNLLGNPFKNTDIINRRYALSNEFSKFPEIKKVINYLRSILDIERFHRKMGLALIYPFEFVKLHENYKVIIDLLNIILLSPVLAELLVNEINTSLLFIRDTLIEFKREYTEYFDLDIMETTSTSIEQNFIKDAELIKIDNNISGLKNKLIKCCENTNNECGKDIFKLNKTDSEGYFLTCTVSRWNSVKSNIKDDSTIKKNTSGVKLFTTELTKTSEELEKYLSELRQKIKKVYSQKLNEYHVKYNKLFKDLVTFIGIIDTISSNNICQEKYNYCCPMIIDSAESSIECKNIRHPIVELIIDTEYITNDLVFNKNTNGLLLYALNSGGKTTLLKSLGISVILAQCGLYVPCSSFRYSPFHILVSQVDFTDNLWKGKSSFISEMAGLKKILNCAGPNTLCIADEICKTTEVESAIGIVGATILNLTSTNTKFFLTSHLHEICDLPDIKSVGSLAINHLSCETGKDTDIIFNRKLTCGNGPRLYGLEVCKSIIQNESFIDDAFRLRNGISKNGKRVVRKSRYNKKKILDECEICGVCENLETHHIYPQKECNENGIVDNKHFHKNSIFNLACLCKKCHLEVTLGKMTCKGYIKTISGTRLI